MHEANKKKQDKKSKKLKDKILTLNEKVVDLEMKQKSI